MKRYQSFSVHFNAGPGLAVESTRAAIADAHEVIIVDNASTDGSLERLQVSVWRNPKLRIIRSGVNEGFAKHVIVVSR